MKFLIKLLTSSKFKLTLILLLNVAIAFCCSYFDFLYIYFAVSIILGFISIFFLANRQERDTFKVIVFLLIVMMPLYGLAYGFYTKENKGGKKVKKEWSDIIYRNRKTVFQSNETMNLLKNTNMAMFKTCNYIVDSVGMPCFQNAQVKYYSFGKSYFIDLKEELNKATNFILLECYKIVPGNTWNEIFDILRLKAREGVTVKLLYDEKVCTKFISEMDFLRLQNHGIESVPFNNIKSSDSTFVNCRNFKRICVIDGKVGFFGGFNIHDDYVDGESELKSAIKDCGVRLTGESVKNLTVMFFEDYQFATKKVVNLQEYFADNKTVNTKDWVLPYSTNPVSLEHTNKNILLSLLNNAKDNICITTTYLALDDELKNALIVASKSGIKVKLIFSQEKERKRERILSRSYFYELIKEGIEVYEYKGGKMSTKLIMVDNMISLVSTNNLECSYTYKHFNAGVIVYGEGNVLMYNDMRDILNNSQIVTIKDLQKRKLGEKIRATWNKFIAIFK